MEPRNVQYGHGVGSGYTEPSCKGPPMTPNEAAATEWVKAKAEYHNAVAENDRASAALEIATHNEQAAWTKLVEVAGRAQPPTSRS